MPKFISFGWGKEVTIINTEINQRNLIISVIQLDYRLFDYVYIISHYFKPLNLNEPKKIVNDLL